MNAQIVSFHCVVKDKMGRVISSTFNQDVLTYAESQQDRLKGLAKGLQNLRKGEKRRIIVPAPEAYGYYDPNQVVQCSRTALTPKVHVELGDKVIMAPSKGKPERLFRVTEIFGDQITLDANHPLAGQDLIFEIEATAARAATHEELISSVEPDLKARYH